MRVFKGWGLAFVLENADPESPVDRTGLKMEQSAGVAWLESCDLKPREVIREETHGVFLSQSASRFKKNS